MNREIKVAKFHLYPQDEPTGYAVGFSFSSNGRSGYSDIAVSFEETKDKTEEEIVAIALEKLKEGINSQLKEMEAKSPLLGTVVELPEIEEVVED